MALLRFVRRHLEPVDRLGETLFGLIMALGITGAARLGIEANDNRSLFIAVLGCNIAWGIVDGAMFVLGRLFERGRQARLVGAVRRGGLVTDGPGWPARRLYKVRGRAYASRL